MDDLKNIDSIANSIDIVSEKEQAFKELDESRNPYGLIFRGPEI